MATKRRRVTAQFKAKVAMEALRGCRSRRLRTARSSAARGSDRHPGLCVLTIALQFAER